MLVSGIVIDDQVHVKGFRHTGVHMPQKIEELLGVKQKEKFKQLFRLVDVLTLSATPIPRTLYLSLTGARDMSTIETPPPNRPPKTQTADPPC